MQAERVHASAAPSCVVFPGTGSDRSRPSLATTDKEDEAWMAAGTALRPPRLVDSVPARFPGRPGPERNRRSRATSRLHEPQNVMLQLSMRPVSLSALSFTRSFQVPLRASPDRFTLYVALTLSTLSLAL